MNIEIYDDNDLQSCPPFREGKFTKTAFGGEDLNFGFVLDRSSSHSWPDVGYDYKVIVRDGLRALWEGRIRHIEQDTETISVTCLGTWVYLSDYVYIGGGSMAGTMGRLWCDTRWSRWLSVTDDDSSNFSPEKYQMDNRNRLYLAPRKNETFGSTGDNDVGAYSYVSYTDEVKRVTFTYDFLDPDDWVAELYSMDADRSNKTSEWSLSATASGSGDVTFSTERARVEFWIYYSAADKQYTGETGDDCYLKITSLKVYGTDDVAPTVTDVATDVVSQIESATPISDSTDLIETVALTLEPLYYEKGESCYDALDDAASFGDASNNRLVWGLESDVHIGYEARLYVKTPDRETVRYVIPPLHCKRLRTKGRTQKHYATEAWGTYTDEDGVTQYTAKYYAHVEEAGIAANTTSTGDDLASSIYGTKREAMVRFGRVDSSLAVDFLKQWLKEHAHPQVESSVEVYGQVRDLHAGGAWIEPYEVEMGYVVQIPHFRAVEAEGASGDDLREWDTTFLLAGLEYDMESGVAKLIPEGATEDLEAMISFARRFREEAEEESWAKREEPPPASKKQRNRWWRG